MNKCAIKYICECECVCVRGISSIKFQNWYKSRENQCEFTCLPCSVDVDVALAVVWFKFDGLLLIITEFSFTCRVANDFGEFFVWGATVLYAPWVWDAFALQISQFLANESGWWCGLSMFKFQFERKRKS